MFFKSHIDKLLFIFISRLYAVYEDFISITLYKIKNQNNLYKYSDKL